MKTKEDSSQVQCPKAEFTCPCPKTDCENHGVCCRCATRHRTLGNLVNCMREGVLVKQ